MAIRKMGWLSKFQSHRFWGDAHLSLEATQAPPNWNGINLRLINFDNHPIFKIYNLLFLFLFFWPFPIMGFVLRLRRSLEIKQSPKCLPNNLKIVSWHHLWTNVSNRTYFNTFPYFSQGCAGYLVGCAGYVVWDAQAMWWVAQAMWFGLRRLYGGFLWE